MFVRRNFLVEIFKDGKQHIMRKVIDIERNVFKQKFSLRNKSNWKYDIVFAFFFFLSFFIQPRKGRTEDVDDNFTEPTPNPMITVPIGVDL